MWIPRRSVLPGPRELTLEPRQLPGPCRAPKEGVHATYRELVVEPLRKLVHYIMFHVSRMFAGIAGNPTQYMLRYFTKFAGKKGQ